MKPFRSSPLRAFADASALHFFILSCWVMGAAGAPALRQLDMRVLPVSTAQPSGRKGRRRPLVPASLGSSPPKFYRSDLRHRAMLQIAASGQPAVGAASNSIRPKYGGSRSAMEKFVWV